MADKKTGKCAHPGCACPVIEPRVGLPDGAHADASVS